MGAGRNPFGKGQHYGLSTLLYITVGSGMHCRTPALHLCGVFDGDGSAGHQQDCMISACNWIATCQRTTVNQDVDLHALLTSSSSTVGRESQSPPTSWFSVHCVCLCPAFRRTTPPQPGLASTHQPRDRTPHSPLHQHLGGLQPLYRALLQQEAALGVHLLTVAAQQQGVGSQLQLVGVGGGQWVVPLVQGG
jgi:hypothetical protein